jgi:hypothetical protein
MFTSWCKEERFYDPGFYPHPLPLEAATADGLSLIFAIQAKPPNIAGEGEERMPKAKLSVHEFKQILRNHIEEIAKKQGWDINNSSERGVAFQLWMAKALCDYDQGFETEAEESLLRSRDLKADIALEDTNRRHMLIAQCKYESLSKKKRPPVDEEDVNDFFNRHQH